ncbi:deoxycytidine deaminase [Kitasatospora sp. NBC_00374]|uniref:dCTP deaminase n=1 Tax=Kitasatospora sp. NBC_00374 TaxID=2975964 RepID=UPI0030E4C732
MILTGPAIRQEVAAGRITFAPLADHAVNPNSCNYHLGTELRVYNERTKRWSAVEMTSDGYLLRPRRMYLGHTAEVIGSREFAMRLIGCSSNGRRGLFLQLSADLGHTTSQHRWTLEIVAAKPTWIFPGMVAGQVSFWHNAGPVQPTPALYAGFSHPCESQMIGAPA